MDIRNSVFVVTGGSSGLGEATIEMIVAAGGKAVIADVNKTAGEMLAARLGAAVRFVECDVTSEEHARRAIDTAVSAFGGLQGLVNCAGVGVPAKVLGKEGPHPLDRFMKIVNINLVGTFNMIRLAADAMAKGQPNDAGERGVIVNTASVAAYDGQIGQPAYAASKAGVVGMTLPIARELARYGIRVVTIAPGLFETPMMAGLPEEAQRSLAQQVPFPSRLGRPSEFAQLVGQICANQMLNGETIRLDGAIRMAAK
ncbi:MAG: 3-hydroxyacyl-CoA dehydrogenase [Betaproteobacteria bacterium]|nr:3-hydroxyacyl-CoA dehydrogenase [Betaproteobacteria bacterium]MBL8535413.1 3-hydroxyacyl-CoA dehydrogenase [Betaproteobacteria bacterium]